MSRLLSICFCVLLVLVNECFGQTAKRKRDMYENKGNTPFYLKDETQSTCLGPNGFTACSERTLWVLNKRVDRNNTYSLALLFSAASSGTCLIRNTLVGGLVALQTVGLGSCKRSVAKNWEFEFVTQSHATHIKLSTKGMCLVRGQKLKNSVVLVRHPSFHDGQSFL